MTTTVFVGVSLLTEVEDPRTAREFIEATRPGDGAGSRDGSTRARGGAVPADAED